jgi:hypothetical protein
MPDMDLARSATTGDVGAVIERLEKAAGPDRELDVAIVYALYPDIGQYDGLCVGDPPIFWHEPYRKQPCPQFTASIDAALTLVPEGWVRFVDATLPEAGIRVELSGRFSTAPYDGDDDRAVFADHKIEAIATCIAALRARTTSKGDAA